MSGIILGVLCTLFSGVALVAVSTAARQERKFARGVTVSGEIVDLVVEQHHTSSDSSPSGRTQTYVYPVVRFHTLDGREIIKKSQYADTGGQGVGGTVTLTYVPEDPTLVRVAGSSVGKLVIAGFGGAAGVLLTVAIVSLATSLT